MGGFIFCIVAIGNSFLMVGPMV